MGTSELQNLGRYRMSQAVTCIRLGHQISQPPSLYRVNNKLHKI